MPSVMEWCWPVCPVPNPDFSDSNHERSLVLLSARKYHLQGRGRMLSSAPEKRRFVILTLSRAQRRFIQYPAVIVIDYDAEDFLEEANGLCSEFSS